MIFNNILQEIRVPITSNSKIATKLREYRGINLLVLGEGEPPDVHGIPPNLEAYGRGGFFVDPSGSRTLWIDGGPQGSRQGHPTKTGDKQFVDGFYWGADYDIAWKSNDGIQRKGIMYIRGRAGTNEEYLQKNVQLILEYIFKKLPPNKTRSR